MAFDAFDCALDATAGEQALMSVMRAAFNAPITRDDDAMFTLCHAVLIHTDDLDAKGMQHVIAGLAGAVAMAVRREAAAKELLERRQELLDEVVENAHRHARKARKAKAQIRELKSRKRKS